MAQATITITDMGDGRGEVGFMAISVLFEPARQEGDPRPPMPHLAAMAAVEAINAMGSTLSTIDMTPDNPASDWSV